MATPPCEHIPLGGFVLRKTMTTRKPLLSELQHVALHIEGFRLVCVECNALGIAFDFAEDAPSSIEIKCHNCGAPRGTLGSLRSLSCSDRRDLFEAEQIDIRCTSAPTHSDADQDYEARTHPRPGPREPANF